MAEATYGKVLEALGLHHLPAPERVDGILTMAPEELLQKVGKENILMPALDSATFPHPMDFASMESWRAPWCGPLLIVDSQLDGSIFAYAGLLERQIRIGEAFSASLHRTLSSFQSVATSLLSHYNITPDTPDVDVLASIIQFATDIKFYAPAQRAAQKWSANSYLAHFNEPNSWEGLFKDKASHILDVAFLMQNFSDRLNPAQVQIGVDFARDVINFVNGKAPWPQYREEYSARVYGPSQHRGSAYVAETDPVSARDGTIFEIVGEAGLDLVSNAFGVFLAGL
jgi:carboxylesterase type B